MNFWTGTVAKTDEGPAVRFREFTLPLPRARARALQRWAGQQVTLGIRPEHIATRPLPSPDAYPVRAAVVMVQPLGAETILTLRCGELAFVARTDARESYRPGEIVEVYVHTAHAHLFEPANGNAI
jgi:multiple sugar transport system ATP-binding protein